MEGNATDAPARDTGRLGQAAPGRSLYSARRLSGIQQSRWRPGFQLRCRGGPVPVAGRRTGPRPRHRRTSARAWLPWCTRLRAARTGSFPFAAIDCPGWDSGRGRVDIHFYCPPLFPCLKPYATGWNLAATIHPPPGVPGTPCFGQSIDFNRHGESRCWCECADDVR